MKKTPCMSLIGTVYVYLVCNVYICVVLCRAHVTQKFYLESKRVTLWGQPNNPFFLRVYFPGSQAAKPSHLHSTHERCCKIMNLRTEFQSPSLFRKSFSALMCPLMAVIMLTTGIKDKLFCLIQCDHSLMAVTGLILMFIS